MVLYKEGSETEMRGADGIGKSKTQATQETHLILQ